MVLDADDKASTKMTRLAAQLQNVATKYALQQRAAADLKAKLDGLDTTTAKGAATAAKLQTQYDKLQLSMRNTELQGGRLKEAVAAGGTAFDLQGAKMTALLTKIAAGGKGAEDARKQFAELTSKVDGLGVAAGAQSGKIGGLASKIDGIGKAADGQSSKMSGLLGKLASLGAGYIGLQGAQQAVQWAREGAAIQGVADSFGKLAVSAGTTADTLLTQMQKASKGTIADSDLMAKANAANILTQGRLTAELPKLLQIAGASAKAMGTDVNSAFDSIVLGLSRNSKMIIDNLGITVDVTAANQRYADSLGISVNALTDQQKAQAFTNEVLMQGDKLVQTLGTSTLTSAEKIAQADTKIKNFTDSLKVLAGDAIGATVDAFGTLNKIIAGDGSGDKQVQALALTADSYQKYVAAINAGNAPMTAAAANSGALGGAMTVLGNALGTAIGPTQLLTQEQFLAAQALQSYGMSAEQASGVVQGLGGNMSALTTIIDGVRLATDLDATAKDNLTARMIALATASPEAALATAELGTAFAGETITADELTSGLIELESQYGMNSYAVDEHSAFIAMNTDLMNGNTLATTELGQALYDKESADIASANAAAEHAQYEEDLAYAIQLSQYSSVDAAVASAWLAQQYGMTDIMVQKLIADTIRLKQVQAGNIGASVGASVGVGVVQTAASAPATIARARASAARRGGGGRSGGSGGGGERGKSPAVKAAEKEQKELDGIQGKADKAVRDYNKKREDLEQSHVEKLAAIDADAHAKALAAEQKFNTDKFDQQLGFKQGIVDIDTDLWDQANAAQADYWAKSQAMAQAGHAQQAADYYAAGLELANIVATNAQEIRDARAAIAAEEDAAEAARMQERLDRQIAINAQEEQLARDKVAAVENGTDAIETDRQEAIATENADYTAAQDDLKASFSETMADLTRSFDDMGTAAQELATKIIEAAAAATAAINAIPGPAAGPGDGSGEPPPEARAVGGPVRRGMPYLVGEKGPELVVPRYNGTVMTADATAALARSSATAGLSGGGGASNSSMQVVMAAGAVQVAGSNASAGQIQSAVAAGVSDALQRFNKSTGQKALNTRRSG